MSAIKVIVVDLQGRDDGNKQLTTVGEAFLRKPPSKLAVGDTECDQFVPPVGNQLPVSILREEPRQIVLVGFDSPLDEFAILLCKNPLNFASALSQRGFGKLSGLGNLDPLIL